MADMTAPDFGNLGFSANPYFQQSANDALGDTTRAYNMTTQPAFNNAMVNSGSFGNSGVQQMNSEAQRQLQTSLGRQANDMQSGNFWQGMNFNQGNYFANQNLNRNIYNDSFNQNQQQFQNGLNLIGMQQGANTQNLGLGTQIQNTPQNYYNGFNQQANSIGQGYGTATGTSSASGSPLMGALGGYQLASSAYKNFNAPSGGGGGNPYDGSTGFGTGSNYGNQDYGQYF